MYSCCPPNRFASTCLRANLKRKNLQVLRKANSRLLSLVWVLDSWVFENSWRISSWIRTSIFFGGGSVILFVWPAFQKCPAHIWAKDHLPEWHGCREAKACAQWRWWWPPHFTQSHRNFTGGGSQPYELPYIGCWDMLGYTSVSSVYQLFFWGKPGTAVLTHGQMKVFKRCYKEGEFLHRLDAVILFDWIFDGIYIYLGKL